MQEEQKEAAEEIRTSREVTAQSKKAKKKAAEAKREDSGDGAKGERKLSKIALTPAAAQAEATTRRVDPVE